VWVGTKILLAVTGIMIGAMALFRALIAALYRNDHSRPLPERFAGPLPEAKR